MSEGLKVGTRVRIREDPSWVFPLSLSYNEYVGKNATITKVDDTRSLMFYVLDIDDGMHPWVAAWLEEIKPVADKKVDRFTEIINDIPARPRWFDRFRGPSWMSEGLSPRRRLQWKDGNGDKRFCRRGRGRCF